MTMSTPAEFEAPFRRADPFGERDEEGKFHDECVWYIEDANGTLLDMQQVLDVMNSMLESEGAK
jgi:hypothetical protein